jgi:hypothetical protein
MRTMLRKGSRKSRVWVGTAVVAALAVGVLLGTSFAPESEAAAQPVMNFTGGSAVVMSYVSQAGTADYERVMRAYGASLSGSENAQYNQMGSSMKIFRAAEPGPNNTVLYMWIVDPVISGANYAEAQILNDEMPDEVQDLYEALLAAMEGGGRQTINMELVMDF